jgi:glutathione S-transferase
MLLYCFGESGNAYKCALALELSQSPWKPVFVDFFNGEARSPAFLALNEMGEVPVLVDGEKTLTQSGLILSYIAERTGRFGGKDAASSDEIWRWILWDNHKFSSQIGTTRFLANFLPEAKRPAGVIPFLQGRLNAAYKVLNAHLADRDWIVGQDVTIADFSCCSYLYYPEPFGFIRADWPHIDRWLQNIAALPGWKHPYDLMPGNPSERV